MDKQDDSGKVLVGYTTGVFDMFHIGHLNILRRAREQCDFLVVGVTTDELSQTVKSRTPIIPFSERIEIVKSIRYVDRVVPQQSMNKYEAWEKIGFDLMFVGGDWKGTSTWNELEKNFLKFGVRIVYLPYTEHTSSSKLRLALNI